MTTEKRLRLVKTVEEERGLSVQERALRYYTPEQLAEMATKREALKQRWTMLQPIGTCPPRLVEVKKPQCEPLPMKTDVTVCPTCKLPICDDAYGFVRNSKRIGKAVPCPQCSPRVKAIKAARKMERELGDLFGGANIPDHAGPWEFATYLLDGDQVAKEEAWAFANRETVLPLGQAWTGQDEPCSEHSQGVSGQG